MAELQNRIVGIVGRKGSGKSSMARRVLERCPRILVFDQMGEHDWIPNTLEREELDDFLEFANSEQYCAGRIVPEANVAEEFEQLCDSVYDEGNILFGIEEVPMLVSAGHLPEPFARIVRLGRHRKISLLWTAQRPAEVSRTLTAMTDVFILFSTTEPRDLDAIASRCGSDIANKVAALSLHGFLVYDVISRQGLAPTDETLGLVAYANAQKSRPIVKTR